MRLRIREEGADDDLEDSQTTGETGENRDDGVRQAIAMRLKPQRMPTGMAMIAAVMKPMKTVNKLRLICR